MPLKRLCGALLVLAAIGLPSPAAAERLHADFNGDIDILVATNESGVRLWRNRRHGRFVAARPPDRPIVGGASAF